MAVIERPGLRRVRPGLYESTESSRDVVVTPEFAAAVRRHTTSHAADEFLDALVQNRGPLDRRPTVYQAALVGLVAGLIALGATRLLEAAASLLSSLG